MKNSILCLAFFITTFFGLAQDEMPAVWENKLDHSITYYGTGTEKRGFSFAADDKSMSVFSNKDGSIIWSKKYKEISGDIRKIDELIPFWDANAIFFFDRQLGKDQIVVIDVKTADVLWSTNRYQEIGEQNIIYIEEKDAFMISLKKSIVYIKARTGEIMWETDKFSGAVGQYIYNGGDESLTLLNFKPGGLAAFFSGFRNQLTKFDVNTGKVLWDAKYYGRAAQKMNSARVKGYREFLFDLHLEGDRLFLQLNGLQLFDFNTGEMLWNASFGAVNNPKLNKNKGGAMNQNAVATYGVIPDPLITDDAVYVVDMSVKKKQFVKKFDLKTGKLLWTSEDLKKAVAIPALYLLDGKLIVQVGGICEQHTYERQTTSEGTTENWAIKYVNIKPNGLRGLDAETGQLLWDSEKFKKGITNGFVHNDYFIICSGKALYSINVNNGDVKYEVDAKNGGVGLATSIMSHKEEIVVIGDKGISKFNIKDGSLNSTGKWKSSSFQDRIGNILVMANDKGDIACYDLETDCKFTEFKGKKDAAFKLSLDGDYVYSYEKKTVTKLSTKVK